VKRKRSEKALRDRKQQTPKKLVAKKAVGALRHLSTERPNSSSADLDRESSLEIARIINAEDAKVALAVKRVLPQIAQAIDLITEALSNDGRLIYVGTGTSGRIAALDAVECPPTFGIRTRTVQFVIAGGNRALGAAFEADEDSREIGRASIAKKKPTKKDVVVGIAASGRTPFTISAIEYASAHGAKTIAVVCNPNSALAKTADLSIVADVGPEVVAGSTRMKAGTAQKMILNILSTGAMARLGYIYGNLMVNLRTSNEKLRERGVNILRKATDLDDKTAREVLAEAEGSVARGVVMAKAGVGHREARSALKEAKCQVRRAIEIARSK
jgi:N-acetylmuramic acid 6-phosphate etherase